MRKLRLLIVVVSICLPAFCPATILRAQDKNAQNLERKLDEQTPQEPDDVIKVRTELVQTTVSVLDKRGNFIDNLRADDFDLLIDGKPSPILFFDRVVNGSARESNKPGAPRSSSARALSPSDITRTVLFFVDDLHLSAESLTRTRKMLLNYIERDMGEDDQTVIASSSGQLGFLQQLTNEKQVLRAAVDRLKYRPQNFLDTEKPRMTVFQAIAIERNDAEVLTYFENVLLSDMLAATYRSNPQAARESAERMTRTRASRLIHQADAVATQTFTSLASAINSSAQAPGRKLFFFVSDGFLMNNQNPDVRYRLQRITDAAVRSGAVIYTIQASGLNTDFPDASADVALISGVGTGRVSGQDVAVQDPLTQLAADTGGKALLNANDLNIGVQRGLKESNDYYLLAWRPEASDLQSKNFHRIEVSVKNHADYTVQVQRGFLGDEAPAIVAAKADKPKTSENPIVDDLSDAIKGRFGSRQLRTHLLANYLDVANHGPQLSILMQVDHANETQKNGQPESVDVAGVVYDLSGKIVGSFLQNLRPEANNAQVQNATYLNQFDVKPGLYQVRVAARDAQGVTGMAMQWVTVPDLADHELALSSLLIGERDTNGANVSNPTQKAQLKIDKRFLRNSRLRVLTFIYNARGSGNALPRLSARIDVFRGNQAIVSTPAFAIDTKGIDDPARIPYAGELNLASLARGRYRLRVTVINTDAKAFASQEAPFEVE
jgi:VWFA-related protein